MPQFKDKKTKAGRFGNTSFCRAFGFDSQLWLNGERSLTVEHLIVSQVYDGSIPFVHLIIGSSSNGRTVVSKSTNESSILSLPVSSVGKRLGVRKCN